MADNFTANQVQGVLGEFKPVLDEAAGGFSTDNVQGVLGEFEPVLDEAAGGEAPPVPPGPVAGVSARFGPNLYAPPAEVVVY